MADQRRVVRSGETTPGADPSGPLPPEHAVRLRAYADLLRLWAPRLDLVAPGDLARFETRHVRDSLRILDLLADLPRGAAIDVGSGAGLPGVPLAICDPRHEWRLLEPRTRRAAWLEEAVRALGLSCEVVTKRAEEAARDPNLAGAHVVATARALAPLGRTPALLRPLLTAAGKGVMWLGAEAPLPPQSRLWRPGIAIID